MILLDTNVISALLLPDRYPQVLAWTNRQDAGALWTTSISAMELLRRVALLPPGRRRVALTAAAADILDGPFLEGRVASFDRAAAEAAARLAADRTHRGRPVGTADTLIAGIALAHGATLATRNLRDFPDLAGLTVVDPFAA